MRKRITLTGTVINGGITLSTEAPPFAPMIIDSVSIQTSADTAGEIMIYLNGTLIGACYSIPNATATGSITFTPGDKIEVIGSNMNEVSVTVNISGEVS